MINTPLTIQKVLDDMYTTTERRIPISMKAEPEKTTLQALGECLNKLSYIEMERLASFMRARLNLPTTTTVDNVAKALIYSVDRVVEDLKEVKVA